MKSLVKKAPVYYFPDFLAPEEADQLYSELKTVEINRHTYSGHTLARNTAVFGDDLDKIPPKIWGDNVQILAWTPKMKEILEKVKGFLDDEQFNVCLVNHYDNGKNYIGWHSDNEEKGSTYCIASISLGTPRTFSFLLKSRDLKEVEGIEPESERVHVELAHGSLLVMYHPCQDLYLHCLSKDKKIKTERINLTYRNFHYDEEI